MPKFQALEWLYSSPTTFLLFMVFLTMIAAFAITKQLRASILMALLTLVYASFSQVEYITGIMYLTIILIALLLANQLYDMLIGSAGAGEEI